MATYTYKATNNGYTATLTLTPGVQSVVDNTTVVAYKLTLTAGSSYFELWPIGWEIWLAGKQVSYQSLRGAPQKSISAGGTITLASGSTTITHNADGTKSAAVSFRVDGGDDASYLPGTVRYTGGETLPLPTIPRASGLSLSASSVTLNGSAGSVTVTVSAHSTSFRHVAKLAFGSASAQISLAAGATSGTISLPMSMLSQIPNTTSGTATVTLTTYSGDTVIGTATAQLTITAGASIVPTISAFTVARVGQSALDMYVKGYDKARLRTTAAGVYGSTIRTYEVTGGLSGADVTTGVLWTAGTNSWTVKVTDSRGRTASESVSVTVVDYATPSVSGASFERCKADGTPDDDGTYLQVSAAISVASCGGKNSYTAKVQYKLQTASTWTDAGAFSGSSKLYDVGLSDMAYDVRIAVTDKLSTGYANATLDVGDVIMDYDPDAHTLDVLPAARFDSTVNIGGKLTAGGDLTVSGAATFGSTAEFAGKATFQDIAMHYKGSAVRGALRGTSGSNGYVRIMIITIKGTYVNSPILFEYVHRNMDPVSGYISFLNSNGTDPGVDVCKYSCPTAHPFYIYKRATGTWDVYVKKSEAYDSIGITRLSADYGYLGSGLNIEIDGATLVSSLPSGYITATPYNACIDSLTTSGKATLGSASIGGNNVEAVVVDTNNGAASNSSWGYRKYSDGTCDLWAYKSINESCSTALGSWYRSGNISIQDLPFSVSSYVFTYGFEIDSDSGALLWNIKGISGTTGPKFYAIRPTSGAAKGWITVHVHGKWK